MRDSFAKYYPYRAVCVYSVTGVVSVYCSSECRDIARDISVPTDRELLKISYGLRYVCVSIYIPFKYFLWI